MNWPQYTYLGLVGLTLVVHAFKHGEPIPRRSYDFTSMTLIAGAVVWLLWMGNFFNNGVCK